jgi:hypothetical protein
VPSTVLVFAMQIVHPSGLVVVTVCSFTLSIYCTYARCLAIYFTLETEIDCASG